MVRNPYSVLPNWVYPAFVAVALSAFAVYSIWVVFLNNGGRYGPYLSPFYSPEITLRLGDFLIPPALWVAWAPLAFRGTCYYYRKAYFRSFFWHPRSCAVPEPRNRPGSYRGETGFWALNNLHRYALYAITVQMAFLWYDVAAQFLYRGSFHVGLGSLLMLVNVVCLSGYTFGCHALRHLAGGSQDCFSCNRARFALWKGVTVLNVRHDRWAWVSLFTVVLTDVYIRLLMLGVLPHGTWA
ncbi:MAG: hypothetical protein E6I70_00195 [Chloroflexi bacterium]|nr:MAG: hypothetical protein E6I63_00280 [Chloroflexota bacterium]TME21027.1 MAG: hypothetical protein E6I70_00195 [Chloroflexota bacterium]